MCIDVSKVSTLDDNNVPKIEQLITKYGLQETDLSIISDAVNDDYSGSDKG